MGVVFLYPSLWLGSISHRTQGRNTTRIISERRIEVSYSPLPNNLELRPSDIHGYGVFASEDIPAGKVYMFDDLECVDSFTAKQNDCYLLDVQQIHSVKKPNNGTRRFITFQWYNATFQDVLDSIHDSD